MLEYRFLYFLDLDSLWIKDHEQQVEIFARLQLAFPFVFDQLHTVKLYQSLFDLVRSVASQDFQLLIHSCEVKGDFLLTCRLLYGVVWSI